MKKQIYTSAFVGGIVSPSLYGRIDDPMFNHGAERLDNFLINPTGSIRRRPGFQFLMDVSNYRNVRLIPFRFASNQTLVIVLADSSLMLMTNGQFVMSGGSPYRISTPFTADILDSLEYCQNADIITFTSTAIAPVELQRHGATDWRFQEIKTAPDIQPPSSVDGVAGYPEHVLSGSTNIEDDNYNPDTATMDTVKVSYVVTAVDHKGRESVPSAPCDLKCNYYIAGADVTLSWSAVADAVYYRVYRSVSGVYGFLAQVDVTTLVDTGSTPDLSLTPSKYVEPFKGHGGGKIVAITVQDGGSGYIPQGLENKEDTLFKDGRLNLKVAPCGKLSYYVNNPSLDGGAAGVRWNEAELHAVVTGLADGGSAEFISPMTFGKYMETIGSDAAKPTWHCDGAYPSNFIRNNSGKITGIFMTPVSGSNFKTGTDTRIKFFIRTLDPSNGDRKIDVTDKFAGTLAFFDLPASIRNQELAEYFNSTAPKWDKAWGSGKGYLTPDEAGGQKLVLDGTAPMVITDTTGRGAGATAVIKGGRVVSVAISSGGAGYTSPVFSVKSKAGSGARFGYTLSSAARPEFPACCCQYDQRRIFAGTPANPLKVMMTDTGSQYMMSYHVPQQDTDRIDIVALSNDADIIRHAVGLESLVLFTGSSELRVFTQDGGALAPSTVAVRAQSYIGANDVQPLIVNSSIVYVAARGGHPRQLMFSGNAYSSDDLGIRCPHLFDFYELTDLTISKAPLQCLWFVSTSGSIYACSFVPEQKIVAWSELKTPDGKFLKVCAVAEGEEDRLYVVVERAVNGRRVKYIEYMAPVNHTPGSAIMYDSYLAATFSSGIDRLTGLNHLEGCQIMVRTEHGEEGPYRVQGGQVKLEQESTRVIAGLRTSCLLRTVPIEFQSPAAAMSRRSIIDVGIKVGMHGRILGKDSSMDSFEEFNDTPVNAIQNDGAQIYAGPVSRDYAGDAQYEVFAEDSYPLEIMALSVSLDYNGGR